MDAVNLSKMKYIYKIYESKDGVLHCEKFPIIYVNKKYVYFKSDDSGMLDFTTTEYVLDNLSSCENVGVLCRYFWNIDDDFDLNEFQKELKRRRKDLELSRIKNKVERARKEYEDALLSLKVLEGMNIKYKESEV